MTVELWRQVMEAIEGRIREGELRPGDRLESEEELALRLGASRQTVHKAIQELKRKGLVDRKRRWGTTITEPKAETAAATGLLALLFDYSTDYPQGELIRGITSGLQPGLRVILADTGGDAAKEAEELSRLSQEVAGIVAYPSGDPSTHEAYREILAKSQNGGPPLVLIDRTIPGLEADSVVSNNREAVRTATQWAISRGRSRIAFLSGDNREVSTIQERRQGYEMACREAGCFDPGLTRWFPKSLEPQPDRLQVAMEDALFSLLRRSDPITALFCTQDVYAVAALEALSRLGLPPDSVDLITYNDWPRAVFPRSGEFARIVQPIHSIGRRAVELMAQRLSSRSSTPQQVRLPSDFLLPSEAALWTASSPSLNDVPQTNEG